jgi:hypothetical protein
VKQVWNLLEGQIGKEQNKNNSLKGWIDIVTLMSNTPFQSLTHDLAILKHS